MLFGGLVGFSMIGIEWSKLQWLVAALTVGLGFGLQEIFANFVSGLIILFEKPIRIGDTVTIRDLTGSVTRINTRATTISDWDRKEIIVPNKAFITEQFINWSLSDSVTRVVLTVPAPSDANSEEVTQILYTAAERCSLVIDNPPPEVFLVDLQQGIQIFELRIYAAEMGHRMPLRHEIHQLILAGFREHGIDMPFPPFQMRLETLDGRKTGRTLTSAARTPGGKFVILFPSPSGGVNPLRHFCYTGRRATTVMLINPHCQQREEDRSANHPQRAVPVICLNHGLNDGKDVGERDDQHHNSGRQQRRRAGFEDHKRPLQIPLRLKERERQGQEQIRKRHRYVRHQGQLVIERRRGITAEGHQQNEHAHQQALHPHRVGRHTGSVQLRHTCGPQRLWRP